MAYFDAKFGLRKNLKGFEIRNLKYAGSAGCNPFKYVLNILMQEYSAVQSVQVLYKQVFPNSGPLP